MHFRCVVILFVLAVLASFLYFIIFRKQPSEIRNSVSIGRPFVLVKDQEFFSTIDDLLVSEEHVYVVYSEMHLVKVYSIDGKYVCTIAISDQNSHGERMLAYIAEGTLYLESSNDIYEFEGTSFKRYYSFSEDATMRDFINANRRDYRNSIDSENREYFLKGVSVYRISADGQEEVFLKRSNWMQMCSYGYMWVLCATAVLAFICYSIKYGR